jgi:putative hemolysin
MSLSKKKAFANVFAFTIHGGETAVNSANTVKKNILILSILLVVSILFTACNSTGGEMEAPANQSNTAATDYCTENGGQVETRYPFYGTNNNNPLQLSGSLEACTFTAEDGSRILVGLDTLYTDQPSLAALAYRAKAPLDTGDAPASANPSSLYCTQLGGTDTFGGINAAGGGWALQGGADVISLCVFPDLSVIDSWGITYYSEGTVRGADLNDLLRYTE